MWYLYQNNIILKPLEYTVNMYLTENKTKLKYNFLSLKAFICLCP